MTRRVTAYAVIFACLGTGLCGTVGALAADPRVGARVITGDVPVSGDWDGDGLDSVGVFRAPFWHLRSSLDDAASDIAFAWGQAGDIPIVGDWDGDGRDGIGVFRNGSWLLRDIAGPGPVQRDFAWGESGDLPLVGDWDGDGRDGIGVWRAGEWLRRQLPNGGPVDDRFRWGGTLDTPVVGDWNGDGRDEVGVFRPDSGEWFLGNGAPLRSFQWGADGDVPLVGHWRKELQPNRRDSVAVRRIGEFLFNGEANGSPVWRALSWGAATLLRPAEPPDPAGVLLRADQVPEGFLARGPIAPSAGFLCDNQAMARALGSHATASGFFSTYGPARSVVMTVAVAADAAAADAAWSTLVAAGHACNGLIYRGASSGGLLQFGIGPTSLVEGATTGFAAWVTPQDESGVYSHYRLYRIGRRMHVVIALSTFETGAAGPRGALDLLATRQVARVSQFYR